MGALASYSLATSIFLLAGYLIYKWMLATCNQPAFNRAVIAGIYALSLLMPFMPAISFTPYPAHDFAGTIEVQMLPGNVVTVEHVSVWKTVVLWVYIVGVAVMLLGSAISLVRLMAIIRRGERISLDNGMVLVLLDNSKFSPFSTMHYVVMNRADYADEGSLIMLHEQAHLQKRHWVDLLLADLVRALQWYNPAAWLMRRELANVHEYQADRAVIEQVTDARQYQMLLIKKAVGRSFGFLANSLNHSKLKKRITMMCTKHEGVRGRLRALAVAPALLAALVAVNIDAVASVMSNVSSASLFAESAVAADSEANGSLKIVGEATADNNGKVSEKSADGKPVVVAPLTPDVLPVYPGGDKELYAFLATEMNYPKAAIDANEQGRCVVEFTIKSDGEVSDAEVVRSVSPSLDAEALRIVNKMPRWTPGKSNGKAVSCRYSLPVNFRLSPSTPQKPAENKTVMTLQDVVVVAYNDNVAPSTPKPVYFVDGKEYTGNINDINPSDIASINIVKKSDEYPNGKVEITLKK